jgi:hypothetical protein
MIISTFPAPEYGIEAQVQRIPGGRYLVVLLDTDADLWMRGQSYSTLEAAEEVARKIAHVYEEA